MGKSEQPWKHMKNIEKFIEIHIMGKYVFISKLYKINVSINSIIALHFLVPSFYME